MRFKPRWKSSARKRYPNVFEGEVETNKPFEYGVDFYIGDVVQLQNEYGIEGPAYIAELVFSVNESGRAVYPTFKTMPEEGGND